MPTIESLPAFRYHPDPVKSGSFIEAETECKCCGKARGYVYTGSFYTEEDDLEESICPWCIADGKAAKKFAGAFTDEALFVDEVPAKVVKEVTTRTPGFSSWQQEEWPICCNDATAFIAPVGNKELTAEYGDWTYDVTRYIVNEMKIYNNEALDFLKRLDRDHGPTAYLFKCLHCSANKAYIDFL
jgi:uncharacterized protein CbrC (UPF0167 family)